MDHRGKLMEGKNFLVTQLQPPIFKKGSMAKEGGGGERGKNEKKQPRFSRTPKPWPVSAKILLISTAAAGEKPLKKFLENPIEIQPLHSSFSSGRYPDSPA